MKKVLFLGAGLGQSYAIQRARALGYYTIAIDNLDRAIGFQYAHQSIHMALDNIKGCLAIAQINQIDGIMGSFVKNAMITAATIMSTMDLPGVSLEVADTIKNRFTLRSVLSRSEIMTSEKIYLLKQVEEIDEIKDMIQFPVIVKAIDASGMSCKLARKVETLKDLVQTFHALILEANTENVMVEEYIEGSQLSFEILVTDGETHIIGVMEKLTLFTPECYELGYRSVARLEDDQELRQLIHRTVRALGIYNGSYHIEVISTANHVHHVVHVKAGVGGSMISSHIIPKVLRYKYLDNIIKASVNDPYDLPPMKYRKNVVSRKVEVDSEHQIVIPDLTQFQKLYHVNLILNQDDNDQSLYIVGFEDSLYKAEMNVDHVQQLILENYQQARDLKEEEVQLV